MIDLNRAVPSVFVCGRYGVLVFGKLGDVSLDIGHLIAEVDARHRAPEWRIGGEAKRHKCWWNGTELPEYLSQDGSSAKTGFQGCGHIPVRYRRGLPHLLLKFGVLWN